MGMGGMGGRGMGMTSQSGMWGGQRGGWGMPSPYGGGMSWGRPSPYGGGWGGGGWQQPSQMLPYGGQGLLGGGFGGQDMMRTQPMPQTAQQPQPQFGAQVMPPPQLGGVMQAQPMSPAASPPTPMGDVMPTQPMPMSPPLPGSDPGLRPESAPGGMRPYGSDPGLRPESIPGRFGAQVMPSMGRRGFF